MVHASAEYTQRNPSGPLQSALRRFDTIASALRGQREKTDPAKEKQSVSFERVIFGHSYGKFDRDQLLTYYFALQAGVISRYTPIEFQATATLTSLQDKKALVIEGATKKQVQGEGTHVFINGEDDTPAAFQLYQQFSRSLSGSHPYAGELKNLRNWITAVETGQYDKLPQNSSQYENITEMLYALKDLYSDPSQARLLLSELTAFLDLTLDHKTDALLPKYRKLLEGYKEKQQEKQKRLDQEVQNPERIRTTLTRTGLRLTLFDVRGIGAENGAIHAAAKATGADIVVLVDTQPDGSGEANLLQFILKIPKEREEKLAKIDLRRLLSQRLTQSEMLFGAGFSVSSTSGFDGHPGVIGSSALGSELDPTKVWIALLDFFDRPRFTESQFEEVAHDFAEKLDTKKYTIDQPISTDPVHLSQWRVHLSFPSLEGGHVTVTISEEDIPYYQTLLSENSLANRLLLSQKTNTSEPVAVAALRQAENNKALISYIEEGDVLHALLTLEQMNIATIQSLSTDIKLHILECITRDEQAIDAVWNPENMLFRITALTFPDWINRDASVYKASRYKSESVPQKVDTILIDSLISKIFETPDRDFLSRTGASLIAILTSGTYKKTHTGTSHDRLLPTVIRLISDQRIPMDIAEDWAEDLLRDYGTEMKKHWQSVPASQLSAFATRFPEVFSALDIPAPTPEPLLGLSVSHNLRLPDKDNLLREIQGGLTEVTFLVEIGDELEEKIVASGTIDRQGTRHSLRIDGKIHVDNFINFDTRDPDILTSVISEQIQNLLSLSPDLLVRLVFGRFPNILSQQVCTRLGGMFSDTDKHRLLYTNFDPQQNRFLDIPAIS